MCGRAVQDLVLSTRRKETRLKLEAGEFPMFLEVEDEAIIRAYILFKTLHQHSRVHSTSQRNPMRQSSRLIKGSLRLFGISVTTQWEVRD